MADVSSEVSKGNDAEYRKSLPRSPNLRSPRPKVYKHKPKRIDEDFDLIIDEIEDRTEYPTSPRRPMSRLDTTRKFTSSLSNSNPKSRDRSPDSVDSLTFSDSDDVTPCYHRKSSVITLAESECVTTEPDCYRSSIVGTKYRRVRFDDDDNALEDKAAAQSVEPYFRKWKMKTIFQILEIYRARRRQEFIYFTQQVHLYSQEVKAHQDQIKGNLELNAVREEATGAHRLILNRSPSLLRKFPLDQTLDAYFDTSYLYEPPRGEEVDWEKPFRSKDIKPQPSKTEEITGQELSATIKKLDIKYNSVMLLKKSCKDDDNLSTVSSGGGYWSESSGAFVSAAGSRASTPTSPRPILKKRGYVK
ncbi:uncharacterized protein LOC143019664 [Oratosquilla oratoria]|uniref:uncharacterized protein LOC143019664 n=1 Tax=Oratosquilla oratoria TaxID=337810 RepID=UPI003F7754BE